MNKPETIERRIFWTQGPPPKDGGAYHATIRDLKLSGYYYRTKLVRWWHVKSVWEEIFEDDEVAEEDIMCWTENLHDTVPERFLK